MTKIMHTISRESNLRGYTYEVSLWAKTGSLYCIAAGCRQWTSFDEAFEHYTPSARTLKQLPNVRWSQEWFDGFTGPTLMRRHAERLEAIAILQKLRSEAIDYQMRCKATEAERRRRAG